VVVWRLMGDDVGCRRRGALVRDDVWGRAALGR